MLTKGDCQQTMGYCVFMSLFPLRIVDIMHVTFAENLDNNPSELLSLPDRSAEHYFIEYTPPDKTDPLDDIILDPVVPVTSTSLSRLSLIT